MRVAVFFDVVVESHSNSNSCCTSDVDRWLTTSSICYLYSKGKSSKRFVIDNFYRPQTKFAKVMFSRVFVCLGGAVVSVSVQGGLCPEGSLCPGGLCPGVSVQGVSFQGVSAQGGLCPGGLCPRGSLSRGVSVHGQSLSIGSLSRKSLCPGWSLSKGSQSRGVSVQGGSAEGSLSKGVSVQGVSVHGGLCPGGVSVQEESLSRGVSGQGGPCQSRESLPDRDPTPPYGKERAVRILLE